MRTIRSMYRLVRFMLLIYGTVNAILKSRGFVVVMALLRMLMRRRVRSVRKTAALTFVDGGEPAIYRRQGWRKLTLQRRD
ncbi:hypothetical protein [Alicyclobacillus ferrooxydans]|uniref:Uncharacterized protein n=1 Tax=Alicyclobacillus ferrooxydans TaxID=471514 RepID=A0A0P9GVL0_9BACL|nr:hypothetical protein [Alicyclobacillus ferrooxydans]KPV45306.1 hypothetical protein AN477_02775 [Alicyclobacillus ferrooxydans]